MSSLKPEDKETPRISPGTVQCTWKVEELFTNEVQKASHNLDKDCAEVKSKIISVSQIFMRHLREEIKAKRHNYSKIKLVKFFLEGQTEIPIPTKIENNTNDENAQANIPGGRTFTFNKAKELREIPGASSKALALAASQKQRMDGFGDAALATKKLSLAPGEFGAAAREAIKNVEKPKAVAEPVSDFEALAYILRGKVTRQQYKSMIKISRKHKSKTWPNYDRVEDAKKECLPPNIYHSPLEVWVPLQVCT